MICVQAHSMWHSLQHILLRINGCKPLDTSPNTQHAHVTISQVPTRPQHHSASVQHLAARIDAKEHNTLRGVTASHAWRSRVWEMECCTRGISYPGYLWPFALVAVSTSNIYWREIINSAWLYSLLAVFWFIFVLSLSNIPLFCNYWEEHLIMASEFNHKWYILYIYIDKYLYHMYVLQLTFFHIFSLWKLCI